MESIEMCDCSLESLYNQACGEDFLFQKDYTIIDLETTGLSWRDDEILEFAAIKVRNNEIIDTFQRLAKPTKAIGSYVEKLTGVTNELVKDCRNPRDELKDFLDFIGDDLIVGHNVRFDLSFIRKLVVDCFAIPYLPRFIDTIRVAKLVVPYEQCFKLGFLHRKYVGDDIQGHRALNDCQMTYNIYVKFGSYGTEVTDGLDYSPLKICCDVSIDDFKKPKSKKTYYPPDNSPREKDYICQVDESSIDKDGVLYGKLVCITGDLPITREDALQAVKNLGGVPKNSVTMKLDYLVVANDGFGDANYKSGKQCKAEEYIAKGCNIQIIDGNTFLKMIGVSA